MIYCRLMLPHFFWKPITKKMALIFYYEKPNVQQQFSAIPKNYYRLALTYFCSPTIKKQ